MSDCETLSQEDDEILNHQIKIELEECWRARSYSDSEYNKVLAMLVKEEVTSVIELNQQTQSIQSSPVFGGYY